MYDPLATRNEYSTEHILVCNWSQFVQLSNWNVQLKR